MDVSYEGENTELEQGPDASATSELQTARDAARIIFWLALHLGRLLH